MVADDGGPRPLVGPQVLGFAAGVVDDHRIGGVEDVLGAAVVLLQHHDADVVEGSLELEDVADVGATEGVDRLVGVAHRGHLAAFGAQADHQLVLHRVGVLVLVHEHMGEPLPPALQHLRAVPEQLDRAQQQIVEVHGRGRSQAALVVAEHLGDAPLEDVGGPLGVLLGIDAVVLGRGDGGVDRPGREPLVVEVQVAQHVPAQAHRVALVVDGEAARVVDVGGVAAQDAHAGRVERRHPHTLRHRPNEGADAVAHLAGGLVGEGDGQDLERRQAVMVDQVGDAMGEHAGLARPRPGHHQKRSAGMGDRLVLGRVQVLQNRRLRHRGSPYCRRPTPLECLPRQDWPRSAWCRRGA